MSVQTKPFLFKDLTTGIEAKAHSIHRDDNVNSQLVCISGVTMTLLDFLDLTEYILLSRDLSGETDLLRIKQRDIAELITGEGRSSDAKRFRPAIHRTLAGTRASEYGH